MISSGMHTLILGGILNGKYRVALPSFSVEGQTYTLRTINGIEVYVLDGLTDDELKAKLIELKLTDLERMR